MKTEYSSERRLLEQIPHFVYFLVQLNPTIWGIWNWVEDRMYTRGPPLMLFFETVERKKNVLEGKTALEDDFLSTIYYQNRTTEFNKKTS